MLTSLLKKLSIVVLLSACASSRNTNQQESNPETVITTTEQPDMAADEKPRSLMELPQTQDGGFILSPGFYEAEFKTYCLQPGTPDPAPGDAYLQGPVTGYRKDIVETVLLNSRQYPAMSQRNVQLLLWSVVSGASFDKLSVAVRADANKLLTPKQVFQLKGGVAGVIKTVSHASGLAGTNSGVLRLFETGISSYEAFEKMAVRREPSKILRKGVKYDQWYRQPENYYVRYFPASYQKVKIQVYVPDGLLDTAGKVNNEYLVYDPTGQQAIPAFTNAQRLGIGAPVIDIVRVIIQVNKKTAPPKQIPPKKKKEDIPVKGKEA